MAEPPPGLEIVILKPTNYEKIIERSAKAPEPYTAEVLEEMYRKGLASNCAVLISFITPELWD